MRGGLKLLALASAASAYAGCNQVTTGADKIWPALVVVAGTASVPATFTVAAELKPAKALAVRLVPYGAAPWAAVGVGRVIGTEGRYSVSIPENELELQPRAFEAQALEPGGRIVLASPVALGRTSARVERDLTPATTVVALAARRAGPARSVTGWDVDALTRLPDVKAAAEKLGSGPLPAGTSPAALSSDASGSTEVKSFALLPAAGIPAEVEKALTAILKAAP